MQSCFRSARSLIAISLPGVAMLFVASLLCNDLHAQDDTPALNQPQADEGRHPIGEQDDGVGNHLPGAQLVTQDAEYDERRRRNQQHQ